jgi:hypothetical protein
MATDINLRRGPALLWIGLLAPIVQALTAFVWDANPEIAGVVNAAAVALAGAITAAVVKADNLVPAITGAFQALIAVVVAFGADWTTEQQAALMLPLGLLKAPVPPIDAVAGAGTSPGHYA